MHRKQNTLIFLPTRAGGKRKTDGQIEMRREKGGRLKTDRVIETLI